MKIILVLLLFIAACLRAEEEETDPDPAPPDPDNTPAEVEPTPAERKAAELILEGDASALMGDREKALALWSEVLALKGAGVDQRLDARERLQWAHPENGGIGWGPEKPGQAFAFYRRNYFLGADEARRRAAIREYCADPEHNEPHAEFDAYAEWLQSLLPQDKNFELLPLILEGDLGRNRRWQSQMLSNLNYDFLHDPERTLHILKTLGSNGAADVFTLRLLDEDGQQTFMSRIVDDLLNPADEKRGPTRLAVKKFVGELPNRTLDTDLVYMLLDGDNDQALGTFLTKHGAKLAALKPDLRNTVLHMLENVKGCPKKSEMDELLHLGDASALAGEREEALALWGRVLTLTPTGIVPRQDAQERLAWARGINGTGGWDKNHPGRSFALHMRDRILGSDESKRLALIRDFCANHTLEGDHRKFSNYAGWLQQLLPRDRNFELLPPAMEDALAENKKWLSQILGHLTDSSLAKDPPRAIKAMKILGFLGDAETFRTLPLDDEGKNSVMGKMIDRLQEVTRNKKQPSGATLRREIEDIQSRTFGVELVLALLADEEDKALADFINQHQKELGMLKGDRRREVLAIMTRDLAGFPNTEEMSEAAVEAIRPLLPAGALKTTSVEEKLGRILSPDKVQVEHADQCPAAVDAANLIGNVAERHPEKAAAAVKTAVALLQKIPEQADPSVPYWKKPLRVFIKQLHLQYGLFTLALREADETGILTNDSDLSWLATYVRCYFQDERGNFVPGKLTARQVVDFFFPKDSDFLAEAGSFQPVDLSKEAESYLPSTTVLASIVNTLNENDHHLGQHLKQDVLQILHKDRPQTFGRDFVEAMLTPDAMPGFIRTRASDFAKIPPDRRFAVLVTMQKSMPILQEAEKLDPAVKEILKPLLVPDPEEIEKQFQRFVTARSLASLRLSPLSCIPVASRLLDQLAQTDIKKARLLYDAVAKLIKSDPILAADREFSESRILSWQQWAAAIPEMFGFCVREAAENRNALKEDWFYRVRMQQHEANFDSPERILKLLESGFFLGDASEFRTFTMEGDGSFLKNYILAYIQARPRTKAAVISYLEKQKVTFGVDLVKTLLERKPGGMLAFLSKHADEINKMPHEHHGEITTLAGLRAGSWLELAHSSAEWNRILQPILPAHRDWVMKKCKNLLNAAQLKDFAPDLGGNPPGTYLDLDGHRNPFDGALAWISEMMLIDPDTARRTHEHLLKLAVAFDEADKPHRNNPQISYSNVAPYFLHWSATYPLLAKLCINAADSGVLPKDSDPDLPEALLIHMTENPMELSTMMEALGFLEQAQNFDASSAMQLPEWLDNGPRPKSSIPQVYDNLVLHGLIKYLTAGDTRRFRKRCHAHLSSRQPRTFGSDFILAVLDDHPEKSVPAFYKAYEADFPKLNPPSRKAVATLMRNAWAEIPAAPAGQKQ